MWLVDMDKSDTSSCREGNVVAWYLRNWCLILPSHPIGADFQVTFVSGYIVWNIDNVFCAELRAIREVVGMPLGFVTELHGW